jgi:uncharacterized protein involved in exopolysaccharide biosynthesis
VGAKRRVISGLEAKLTAAASGTSAPTVTSSDVARRTRARRSKAELDMLDQQIAGKEADLQRLRQVVADYRRRVEAVPGHESQMVSLMRDYDTLEKVYSDLLAKKENSQISANLEREQVGEQFRVLDPARLPEKAFTPNRPRIAMFAAAGGVLFALLLIGFLEYRDQSLRTEDEIVRTLVLPVIAAIPQMAAVAEVRRQQRNRIVMALATMVVVIGASVAVWQLGR